MKLLASVCLLLSLVCLGLAQSATSGAKATTNLEYLIGEWTYVLEPAIQTDLKLTDDQKARIARIHTDSMDAMWKIAHNSGTPDQVREKNDADAKLYFGVLSKEQRLRVREIWIQRSRMFAILVPSVQEGLAMTDDQRARAKEARKKYQETVDNFLKESIQKSDDGVDLGSVQQERATAAKDLQEALGKILTEAQIAKLKELGGKLLPPKVFAS